MNENRFTGKAEIYAKYRPTYPKYLIQHLYSEVGFNNNSVIADIGSGTGILTKILLQQGSFVYGVEPNEDMRNTAETSLNFFEKFISINSSAENIKLDDSSVDFITVSQAFHLFDKDKFKSECKRILKSTGKVIIITNPHDKQNEMIKAYHTVVKKYRSDDNNIEIPMSFFKKSICEHKVFNNSHTHDETSFIGECLSHSYAPNKHDDNYEPYIYELKQFFNKYCDSGFLCIPYLTHCYVGEV